MMVKGFGDEPAVLIPLGGATVQRKQLMWKVVLQTSVEHISEKVVIAIPAW
jgi:hypothetical protein